MKFIKNFSDGVSDWGLFLYKVLLGITESLLNNIFRND